jgi:hypothetical protein
MQSARRLDWQRSARWITAGYALFFMLMSLARVPEFSSLSSVARTGVRNQGDCAINWGIYCDAQVHRSPPDLREAGRAGIIAYRCADYKRLFYEDQNSCLTMGAVECQRLYGDEAANRLLAQALPLMNEQAQCYMKGMILFTEERYGQAKTVLYELYSPSVQAAAHSLGQLCRSGDQQPWDFPRAVDPENRQTLDPNRIAQRNGFSFQAFCLLSAAYCRTGDAASAFDLAALLVNMDPSNSDALRVYVDSCRQLGLQHSAEQARFRLSSSSSDGPSD